MTNEKEPESRTPRTNGMPSLSGLKGGLSLAAFQNMIFRGSGPSDVMPRTLWKYFIRLVDEVVWEYHAASQSLDKFLAKEGASQLYRCVAHMENCIHRLSRAVKFAEKLRSNKNAANRVSFDKPVLLKKDARSRLTNLRNAIEHVERDIYNGKTTEDTSDTLDVLGDGLELAGHTLPYNDLAKWISELHAIAVGLVDYREDKSPQ